MYNVAYIRDPLGWAWHGPALPPIPQGPAQPPGANGVTPPPGPELTGQDVQGTQNSQNGSGGPPQNSARGLKVNIAV